VAEQVSRMKAFLRDDAGREPFILGLDHYSIASELAFYTGNPRETYSQDIVGADGLGYPFWSDPAKLIGRDSVAVLDARERDKLRLLDLHFQRVGMPRLVEISWGGRRVDSFLLVPCKDYRSRPIRRTPMRDARR
jgi:hypothetical protein